MKKENKIYTTAPELAQALGISVGHAYKLKIFNSVANMGKKV